MCTPLRAAHSLVALDCPSISLSWQCVRRWGLRIVLLHLIAQEFRFLGNVCAAEGYYCSCCIRLPRDSGFLAMCTPLRAAHCPVAFDCPSISFSWQCVRRWGMRVVLLHSIAQGFRFLGNVYAAEGCAHCLVAFDCPGISFSWQCVRRWGLRIVWLHPGRLFSR